MKTCASEITIRSSFPFSGFRNITPLRNPKEFRYQNETTIKQPPRSNASSGQVLHWLSSRLVPNYRQKQELLVRHWLGLRLGEGHGSLVWQVNRSSWVHFFPVDKRNKTL